MRFILAAAVLGWLLTRKSPPSAPSTSTTPSTPSGPSNFIEEGIASFYGKNYDGRPTASGQAFDHTLMTAAHKTIKFGTRVKVTDLGNGNSVVVTVNDRGPFPKNAAGQFTRCIDLSEGAAAVIGLDIKKGLTRVRLERV